MENRVLEETHLSGNHMAILHNYVTQVAAVSDITTMPAYI